MNYHQNAMTSSGATVQAVAAALRGAMFHVMDDLGQRQRWLLRLDRLPQAWRRRTAALLSRGTGHHPGLSAQLKSQDLAAWNIAQYNDSPSPSRQFETIVLGAPSGGAAHLCSCLGAPFLSHTFTLHFRHRCHPDDITRYQRQGEQLINPILGRNMDLHAVNHYDPVHDRLHVGQINQVRLKLLGLPGPYVEFIRKRLAPDGILLLLDCTATWGQYTVKPRCTFQVGRPGGIRDQEFIQGSETLTAWLKEQGSRRQAGWSLPMRWSQQVEGEWGLLPAFAQAVDQFTRKQAIRLHTLSFPRVEDFSKLAFNAWQWLYYLQGMRPMGVLVDSFAQINATAPQKSVLPPLWLPSNFMDSQEFLHSMVREFPKGIPVLFQPWPSFSPGPDLAYPKDWHCALHGLRGTWLGADPYQYPMDLASIARFTPALQTWLERHPDPLPRHLRWAEFETLLAILAGTPHPPESDEVLSA